MKKIKALEPFTKALDAVQKLFENNSYQWMILGGIAVSILGKPRFTRDIDAVALLDISDIPLFLERAKDIGLEPRISDVEEFAKKSRVLLLYHKETCIPIDISMGILPFEEETIKRSQIVQIGDLSLHLPTPEDLIIFKAVADRPQDIIDIQGIIESHPQLDRRYIKYWVKEFADVLETQEIYERIKKLL
ncbi:MAG: nucleotidyltransferase [bacterium]